MTVSSHRRLGGGLDAILGAVNTNSSDELLENDKQEFKKIMVNQLVPGQYQPRRQFDQKALEELSLSISKQGIIQPIVVRKINMSEYEIIAGERRWRAAQMAGLQQVPVIICNVTDESALAFSLIENIQRQDLNPIEEAVALKRLVEEFKMTHEQVAESVGRSRSMVTNMLRLLNLVPSVQQLLVEKKLDIGHARLLLVFSKDDQKEYAEIFVQHGMTVREAEDFIKKRKSIENDENQIKPSKHDQSLEWKNLLSKKLSTQVNVNVDQHGVGKITISINSSDEIEYLIKKLSL